MALLCVAIWACALLAACDEVREVTGVYEESLSEGELSAERQWAIRLSVYEFEDLAGGFVEYYELGGINTRQDPYLQPTSCAYFGPFRRLEDGFVVRAPGPVDEREVQIRLRRVERRQLEGTVELDGGLATSDISGQTLRFDELRNESPEESCPANATLLQPNFASSEEAGMVPLR